MNEHSLRLIKRIDEVVLDYLAGKTDSRQLLYASEGITSAVEETPVRQKLEKLIFEINNSIYLYDEIEGKQYLRKEYEKFTNDMGKFE